uniref:Orphan protein n=2 Tax=Pseudoalteromonas translucida TaxID=166935 RepID=A0A6G6AS81_PSET1|nr:hypothetical protein PSHA_p00028 [Pseudoalteromonas translucida TAC125]
MTISFVPIKTIFCASSMLLLISYKPAAEIANNQPTNAEQLKKLKQHIKTLINTPIAYNAKSCKVITLNANDCKPSQHLLYSTKTSDEQTLISLAARYNQLMSKQISSTYSHCPASPKPSTVLIRNVCMPVQLVTE